MKTIKLQELLQKRIYLLNDYIADQKYNITLFTNTNKH